MSQSMHVALETIMVSDFAKLWLDLTAIRVCQSPCRPPNGLDTNHSDELGLPSRCKEFFQAAALLIDHDSCS